MKTEWLWWAGIGLIGAAIVGYNIWRECLLISAARALTGQ